MRAFVAIELPEAIREGMGVLNDRLRRCGVRASWTRRDRMHLTLRFLGDISDEAAGRVGEHLLKGAAGLDAFRLHVSGVGAFPNLRRPSVVWAGIGPLEGGLKGAHAVAEEAAEAIGLRPDRKPFHPHVTLARIRDARDAEPLMECLRSEANFDGGEFHARGMSLFSSQLTPHGPIYTCVQECPFSCKSQTS